MALHARPETGRSPLRRRTAAALLVLGAVAVARPAHADKIFDFLVDRFAVDGNVFGPADGVPDRVDEFDDAFLDGWFTVNGTAFERDGFLHLASPGDLVADGFGAVPGLPLDISQVYYTSPVTRGAGNFTVTSAWASTSLAYGDFNHFSLFAYADPFNPYRQFEVVGVALSNPNQPDAPPAYSATRFVVRFMGGAFEPLVLDSVSIDPTSITGQVVFRHVFDDSTDMVDTSISVDGGATFSQPFAPVTLFTETSNAVFLLGSDPLADGAGPASPPELCTAGQLVPQTVLTIRPAGHALFVNTTITLPAALATGYDPRRDGLQLRIENDAAGDRLVDLTATPIPPGGDGSGCAPEDGWERRRNLYTYRNGSNALPTECMPGSAGGLRTLRVDTAHATGGRLGVRATVRGIEGAASGGMRVTIVLGGDAAAGAAGHCGVTNLTCTQRGRRVRCS